MLDNWVPFETRENDGNMMHKIKHLSDSLGRVPKCFDQQIEQAVTSGNSKIPLNAYLKALKMKGVRNLSE